jgi:antitoxin VapB
VSFIAPIAHVEQIDMEEANRALVRWKHRMGACARPMGLLRAHGMFAHGQLVALTVTADLVRETCAGLSREEAVELARLCAARADLCRPMLRLWREFVFPAYSAAWAVSYQDEALHTGDTYRFDGWVQLQQHARSGTDQRSGRKGRSKTIWGWHPDPAIRKARRQLS